MRYEDELKQQYALILSSCGSMLTGASLLFLLPLLLIATPLATLSEAGYFITSAAVAFVVGNGLRIFWGKRTEATLTYKEGGAIVVLSWIMVILCSAMPFMLSGQLTFSQAVFESTSGWTTTGLSVVDVAKTRPIFLLWRSIMQLFGGAGIAVIMLTAIIGPQGMELYNAEGRSDKLLPNVTKNAKLIVFIYGSYCIVGTIAYIVAGMPWFDAINHAFAALSTGGFSTKVNSIGEYNNLHIEMITIVLMILGTTNFAAHYVILRGRIKQFMKITEVRFMGLLLVVSIPLITLLLFAKTYENVAESFRIALFQGVSAISTTGFSTVSYVQWPSTAMFLMIMLMIIGGGSGSTAGGLKMYRVAVLLKSIKWHFQNYFIPPYAVRANSVYRPDGRLFVPARHLLELAYFLMLYLITYLLGVLVMTLHGFSLQDAMFEFASTLGTVGLSIGLTGPHLPHAVLWTQIIGMFLGRLELVVVFIVLIKLFQDINYVTHKKK